MFSGVPQDTAKQVVYLLLFSLFGFIQDGLTALHCASRSGHDSTADLLLSHGASVSARTRSGLSPLHTAVQGDHADCVRLLLLHGAGIDDVSTVSIL